MNQTNNVFFKYLVPSLLTLLFLLLSVGSSRAYFEYRNFEKLDLQLSESADLDKFLVSKKRSKRLPVVLQISTQKEFSCSFPLVVTYKERGKALEFIIEHVLVEGLCQSQSGPAIYRKELPIDERTKELIMLITFKDEQDQYSVLIKENIITIKPIKTQISQMKAPIFYRTPDDLISVYCPPKKDNAKSSGSGCGDLFEQIEKIAEPAGQEAYQYNWLFDSCPKNMHEVGLCRYYYFRGEQAALEERVRPYLNRGLDLRVLMADGHLYQDDR